MFKIAEDVRNEFCVQRSRVWCVRARRTTNDKLKTGRSKCCAMS